MPYKTTREKNMWCRRLRAKLVAQFGGACILCNRKSTLEFAHIYPTGLNGEGRGQNHRIYDVKRNPTHYALLCRDCHLWFGWAVGEKYSYVPKWMRLTEPEEEPNG